jgi:hypothetical protein
MKKILLEELSRINYLNNYDSNKTSVENEKLTNEQDARSFFNMFKFLD